jgi:hypothetical protein
MMAHTLDSRNDFIMTALSEAVPTLRRIATQHRQDFDELYQWAALIALEHYDKAMNARKPYAYIYTVIRQAISWALLHTDYTLSLDMALSDELDTTLLDTLEAPAIEDHEHEDQRAQALYAALRRLRLDEQIYMRRVYGLNAFNPLPPDWSKTRDRTDDATRKTAYKQLRRDPELAQAVCC